MDITNSTSDSWGSRILYQIYPRSFKDSNNDGIGDLKGIIQKLDYLNGKPESLGIDAIWISPFFKSPMDDFGYDVSGYCDIDPIFGTLQDFDELIKQAHNRNIKVILDFIPSHSSIKHPWFEESRLSLHSPKRDWYIWKDPKPDGSVPNNWISVFGGSMWEYDTKTKQYYLHTFLKSQADLNWRNKEVQKAMLAVLRFWLKRGVDGFRIDAFSHIIKNKDFPNEPINPAYISGKDDPFESLIHKYCLNQPELLSYIRLFQKTLGEFGERFMITESYVNQEALITFYRAGTNLHAPFNFQFISLPWNAKIYKEFIDAFDKSVGPSYFPTFVLGNHDRSRVASRLGRDAARVAAMLQLTLRGIPTIYYGDELGMIDVPISKDKIHDPFEKNVPGRGLGRDPERTPIQWDSTRNSGFSKHEPWLPVSNDFKLYNVEAEKKDRKSFLALYRRLIHYRRTSPSLRFGTYASLNTKNKSTFAYIRTFQKEKTLVVLNFTKDEHVLSLLFSQGICILNTYLDRYNQIIHLGSFPLRPYEGLLIKL